MKFRLGTLLLSLAAGLVVQGQICAAESCSPFWTHYQGHCYRHFGSRVTWHEANRLCREQGGELPSVHTGGENSFINELFRSGTDMSLSVYPVQITNCDASLDATADAILNMTTQIPRHVSTTPSTLTNRPRDCQEVQTAGFNASGRYIVYPDGGEDHFYVFCDMETDGGGWTVFQRRQDGSVDFYLDWTDYKYGFGSVVGEHWLGNENIHRLTSQKTYELRIDLEDFVGNTRYAVYNQFLVANETMYYQLSVGDYDGDAGDSLTYHNGMNFSAKDMDLDAYSLNCAQRYHGAWWYNSCYISNLNGDYATSEDTGVKWNSWNLQLKKTEMKIRPIN